MLVRTDDEVYRVDAVWLGPPRATFPWRARYVSYGVGLLVMLSLMFLQRRLGIGLDFFSVAWALVGTVALTRFLGKKIDYERPLGQVVGQFWAEVTGPRARRRAVGGAVRAAHVRVRGTGGRAGTSVGRGGPGQVGSSSGRGTVAAVWAGSGAPKASPVRIGSRPTPTGPDGSASTGPSRADRRAARKAAKVARKAAGSAAPDTSAAAVARSSAPDTWQKAGSRGRR